MAFSEDRDSFDEQDDYDEAADSDFKGDQDDDDHISSSSEDETGKAPQDKPLLKSNAIKESESNLLSIELDSGDEAAIKEQQKARKKQKRRGEDVDGESGNGMEGWRARTRAMREHDQEEKRRNKLASSKGSTIDVDKIWEEMNRPGPLPPLRMEGEKGDTATETSQEITLSHLDQNKENIPVIHEEEMITIKRKFHFAGEVHEEEKIVPKSSAEARLWLSQQETKANAHSEGQTAVQRPLRKVSRFDPNYNNLAAFKTNFIRQSPGDEPFKGPKLNVVEKSKMDWAAHVDAEGLKDELDIHAKAKEGYHGRMAFLNEVEQRKDEEARLARMKK